MCAYTYIEKYSGLKMANQWVCPPTNEGMTEASVARFGTHVTNATLLNVEGTHCKGIGNYDFYKLVMVCLQGATHAHIHLAQM